VVAPKAAPVFPPGVEPVRCDGCGLWTLEGRACPACDVLARVSVESHDWRIDHDGTPTCEGCSVKVWHSEAWTLCPEWIP
jgi:hypothetical protein